MQVGDRVRRPTTGEDGVVVRAEGDYCDVVFPSGKVQVHVDELEAVPLDPDELLSRGELGRTEPYVLRLQSLYLKHAYKYDELSGLSNARIEPTLHQVYIAHRVTQKLRPRMILADEVGLGKTIEAGLIIKELRAREMINRVLIVCPASLQYQWQQELRSKFNEDFEIIDGAGAKFLGRGGTNPWSRRDNVICSLTFAQNSKQAERIVEAGWDLVVFDEAHRVRRWLQGARKVSTTLAYRLADELKEIVNGLLLLTATPMQLHPFELYSLMELAEPGLMLSLEEYEMRRGDLPRLNDLMKALKGWEAMSTADQNVVLERHQVLLKDVGVSKSQEKVKSELSALNRREELMDALSKRHPLSSVLVRNRKAEIGGFTKRQAIRFSVELAHDELQLYQDVSEYIRHGYNRAKVARNLTVGFLMVTYQKMLSSSSHAIRKSFRKRADKLREQLSKLENGKPKNLSAQNIEDLRDQEEMTTVLEEIDHASLQEAEWLKWEIDVIEGFIARLGAVRDSKAAALLELVDAAFKEHRDEKMIVFTQFLETQEFLAHVLETNGYSVEIFNGNMKLDEKEDAVRRFRSSAQVLVSSEAGGEGRNFQFCHLMVNYDLPWNPMKVEQRIGRLDRIGQTHPVFIYNLFCEGTVEERVLQVLDQRIGLFEESVGSLDPILGEVEKEIEQIVMEHADHFGEVFEEYEGQLEQKVREARERERTLADFALDRSSLRKDIAAELLRQSPLARWLDLQTFVSDALTYFGGTLKGHSEGGEVISLSPKLAAKLKSGHSAIRGTFNPEVAREIEDVAFFAFGHETIDRLIEVSAASDDAGTGARRVDSDPAGTWVEVLYQIRGEGVRPSGKILRHLVNEDLEVRTKEVRSVPESGELISVDVPSWASDAVRASRLLFEKEHREYRERVRDENLQVREEELARADRIFRYRQIRLRRLIEEHEQWIREKEASGSERDKRILPARRGQLAKRQEDLQRLEFDHTEQVREIEAREAGTSALVLAAGIVVGAE